MASFDQHIAQSERNIKFLEVINSNAPEYFDWQVTVCFYSALHLMNAHLSKFGLQYRKHRDVNNALNFANATSMAKLPEDIYISYTALQSLSRRSRYLVNEKKLTEDNAAMTYEVHLTKAIRHLDKIISYFSTKYKVQINTCQITSNVIKAGDVQNFRVATA